MLKVLMYSKYSLLITQINVLSAVETGGALRPML